MYLDSESSICQELAEQLGVAPEAVEQSVGLGTLDQIQSSAGGSNNSWGQAVGEQVWATAVAEQVDHLLASSCVATSGTTKSLAQSRVHNVHTVLDAKVLSGTTAVGSQKSSRVAVVDKDQGVVLIGQVADLVQGGDLAVHAEDSVSGDQLHADASLVGLLELGLQV